MSRRNPLATEADFFNTIGALAAAYAARPESAASANSIPEADRQNAAQEQALPPRARVSDLLRAYAGKQFLELIQLLRQSGR